MKKNLHYRADFLNQPFFHSDATIFSYLTIDDEEERYGWNASLMLRDCSQTISFEIEAHGTQELENTIYKLNTLINHLTELRNAVIIHGRPFADKCEMRKLEKAKKKSTNEE